MTGNGLQRARKGFTLVELMVTIAIVAVLALLAFPSMSRLILKHRAQDAASDIFTTLFKARSEALRRVDTVTLRPNTPADWTSGWKIMDSSSNILDTHNQLVTNLTIGFAGTSPIVFTSSGRISSTAPTFTVTASNGVTGSGAYSCTYTVSVDPTGRPYETSNRDSNTAHTAGGGAPSC